MTFGLGLGAGLKALTAAQLGLQTAGHNVANANTPGYSRQRVVQSSTFPFSLARGLQIGTGVDVNDIARVIDDGLARRINLQTSLFGQAEVNFQRMSEIEGMFAEPDGGLSNSLGELFGSIGSLQTDPADRALRGGVVQSARTLTDNLRLLSRRFGDISENTFDEVRGLTRSVNDRTAEIAQLNSEITSVESHGSTANDLRDRRGRLIEEIAELADTRVLERSTGSLDLMVAGHLIVSGDRSSQLRAEINSAGRTDVLVGSATSLRVQSGKIGALLNQEGSQIPGLVRDLDSLAYNLALEFNRNHTTGIPGSGPFQTLTSSSGVADTDNDGSRGDELLSSAGLPFDIVNGSIYISVTDRANGDIERTRIDVDPGSMTLNDFSAAINSTDHLTATVDPAGRLRINAENGYGFDFAARLDESPDSFGSFGSDYPSLGTAAAGPFDFSGAPFPQSFDLTVNGSTETVTLNQSDFRSASNATVDELATAINSQIGDTTAKNVGGRLVLRANASGSSANMSLTDQAGGPLAAMGMAMGPATGQDAGFAVDIAGSYTGTTNGRLTFVPDGDGEIGVTPGLTVSVFDDNGSRIATLDVGQGYLADQLDVVDGIKVTFPHGANLSATNNEVFALDTIADADTSDLLAAIGMNAFFHGSSASDLSINEDLERNPDLLAAGLKDASADGGNLARLLELRETRLSDLGSSSFEDFYGDVVGDLGFDVATADSTLQSQGSLLATLGAQRESISGVNLDEEMVDLVKYQQAYEAAARFINTVQELSSTLINLGR